MAFLKAKITRFNEVQGCAPPPGSYDPKFDTKLVGGVLSKTQRFLEPAEETASVLNTSKCSVKSTDEKTPRKTPKYLKPAPRSLIKCKKVSSLQDLSKPGSMEVRRLEEEIERLQSELNMTKTLKSRVHQWMSVLQAAASTEDSSSLQEILSEMAQLGEEGSTEVKSSHMLSELAEKQRLLIEAEATIEELRDQVGEAGANVCAMRDLADQTELAYKTLQSEMSEQRENFDRIVSQLQSHLRICEEDRNEFQDKLCKADDAISRLQEQLNEAIILVSSSEEVKNALQNQLLEKCDLLEEFLHNQEKLQNDLIKSNEELSAAQKNLQDTIEVKTLLETEFNSKTIFMKEELAQSHNLVTTLQEQLLQVESLHAEVEHSKQNLEAELEQSTCKYDNLESELYHIKKLAKSMEEDLTSAINCQHALLQEKEALCAQLQDVTIQHQEITQKYTDGVATIAALEADLQTTMEAKGVLQVNLVSVESNVSILKEKITEKDKNNEELQVSLMQANSTVVSLKQDLENATGNLCDLEAQRQETNKQIEHLEESLKTTSLRLDEYEICCARLSERTDSVIANSVVLEDKISYLAEGNADLENQLESVSALLEDVSSQKDKLQAQLDNVLSENSALNLKVASIQDEKTKIEVELVESSELTKQLQAELVKEKEQNTKVVEDCSKRVSELEKFGTEMMDAFNAKQKELAVSKKIEKQLTECLEDSKEKSQFIDTQVTNIEIQLKESMNVTLELRSLLDELKANNFKLEVDNEELVGKLNGTTSKVTVLEEKLIVSEKAKEKLQRKLSGTKNLNKNNQEKLAEADNKIAELTKDLEEAKTSQNNMKSAMNAINEVISEVKKEKNKIKVEFEELREQEKKTSKELKIVTEKMGEINADLQDKLQSALESKHQLEEQIQMSRQEIIDLQEKVTQLENEKCTLESNLKESNNNVKIIQEELMHAKEHLQEHMGQANRNIAALQEQLSQYHQESQQLQSQINHANDTLAEVRSQLLCSEKSKTEAEWQLSSANQQVSELNSKCDLLVSQVDGIKEECNSVIASVKEKVDQLTNENKEIGKQYSEANDKIFELEEEITETLKLRLEVEDELHEVRVKVANLQDQLFDINQEKEDMQIQITGLKNEYLVLEEDKKNLEEEYSKAEKEWDQREQKLQLDLKLLSDEVKLTEEKQVEYEAKLLDLGEREVEALFQIKILKDESEWAETRQLELESELNELQTVKETLTQELEKAQQDIINYVDNEKLSQVHFDACKNEVIKVSEMLTELKDELNILKQDFIEQDEDITELETQVGERDEEIACLKEELERKINEIKELDAKKHLAEDVAKLQGQLADKETELGKLSNEVNSRVHLADEMEDLLQRKIEELGCARDHVTQLEARAVDLEDQVAALAAAEQTAQEDKRAAQFEAHQLSLSLAKTKEEFSQRWSTVEDSILNVESVETRNKELTAADSSLRTQLTLLEAEATRLRNGNRELRARLGQLERQEARSSGHQNQQQKLSYMQHLKEIILKHQQSEEELHERLVTSECHVAQLEAELQKRPGHIPLLSKSMLQPTAASLAKKTPKPRRGKENDRSLISTMNISRSTSMLTSTPLHPKSLNH